MSFEAPSSLGLTDPIPAYPVNPELDDVRLEVWRGYILEVTDNEFRARLECEGRPPIEVKLPVTTILPADRELIKDSPPLRWTMVVSPGSEPKSKIEF